jgi:quercetin dioxygenase-like cupin family protein
MSRNENPWVDIVPGIRRQTITTGATMYQMRAELAAGSQLPVHAHPQEQVAHVISGRIRFNVDGETREVSAGESLHLPSNVPHGAETLEAAVVIDTFSPPRTDYLARDEEVRRVS